MKPSDPAFPIALGIRTRDGETRKMDVNEGLTIRGYVAAQALNGLLACPEPVTGDAPWTDLAKAAVRYADALIVELSRSAGGKERA